MTKRTYTIGRGGDITLYDDTVSRRHARLELDDDVLTLRDLGSRNGTFEIHGNKLVRFAGGTVTRDQVFAFGDCVRSVVQLLAEAGVVLDALSDTAGGEPSADEADPLEATKVGVNIEQQKDLTPADTIALLELIEDRVARGQPLAAVCHTLGVSEQRYVRWCHEHGSTRADREKGMLDLRLENERLRRMLADISLEREMLKEALKGHSQQARAEPPLLVPSVAPSLTIVGERKPKS